MSLASPASAGGFFITEPPGKPVDINIRGNLIQEWILVIIETKSSTICCGWAGEPGEPTVWFSPSANVHELGGGWCKPLSEGSRTGSPDSKGRRWVSQFKQKEKIYPSSVFLFFQALSGMNDTHWHWGGWIFSTQSADSNANLLQRCPHRLIRK